MSAIRVLTNETMDKRYGLLICLHVGALSLCLLRECDGLEGNRVTKRKRENLIGVVLLRSDSDALLSGARVRTCTPCLLYDGTCVLWR